MTNIQILCIAVILLYTLLTIIHFQTGKRLINKKPKRQLNFITSLSKNEIYQIIFDICVNAKYIVEFMNVEAGLVIISEDPSFFHGGYFYPIYLEKNKENKIEVQVYVKSKWIVSGILISRCHKNLFNLLCMGLMTKVDNLTA